MKKVLTLGLLALAAFSAAAFRLYGGDGIGVGRVLDQLERHRAAVFRVLRQIHVGHAAASQLANDFVLADFATGGGDHSRTGLPACLSLNKAGETACPTNRGARIPACRFESPLDASSA